LKEAEEGEEIDKQFDQLDDEDQIESSNSVKDV
jgi:hypothetical protein